MEGPADDPPARAHRSSGTRWDRVARQFPSVRWTRAVGILVAGALAAALIPPLRWPTVRMIAAATTTFSRPVVTDLDELGPLDESTRFVDRHRRLIARTGTPAQFAPVSLGKVPDHVVDAVLAAEDHHFYDHPGVDPLAVARAAVDQLQGGRQGGSTITQQVAKLNYTTGDANLLRKAREAFYAVELERQLSKDEILERYLNQVYFGDAAYGVQAASRTFFGVDVQRLDVAQAATLAGKIRAPDELDPHERPDAVTERRNRVLVAMAAGGWISQEEADVAARRPLEVRPQQPPPTSRAPWFTEHVESEARKLPALGPDPESRLQSLLTGGYIVETTLDLAANQAASAAVEEHLGELEEGPTAAVASVEPNDGAIRVMVGGLDYSRQQFNAASQGRRQPGSAFKPFVYLAALDEGIDPRSRFPGPSQREFEHEGREFEVHNYGNQGYGHLDLDRALVRSVNTAYMALGLEVGPQAVVDVAHDAGLPDDIQPVPAVSLGGIDPGVTPIDMAEAYATLAAEGTHAEPYAISRIIDAGGEVVYQREPQPREHIEREHVLVLNRALREVVEHGTGRAAALDRDVAGKTGTSSHHRDAWFAGFVPQLATTVWVGHLDGTPMEGRRSITGGSIPAMIFHDVMVAALAGVEPIPIATLAPEELDLRILRPRRAHRAHRPRSTAPPETATTTTPPPETTTTTPTPSPAPPPPPSSSTTEPPPSTTTTAAAPPEKEGTTSTTEPPPPTTTTAAEP